MDDMKQALANQIGTNGYRMPIGKVREDIRGFLLDNLARSGNRETDIKTINRAFGVMSFSDKPGYGFTWMESLQLYEWFLANCES